MEAKYEHSLQEQQENTSRNKVLNACMHLKDQRGLGVLVKFNSFQFYCLISNLKLLL